MKPRARIPRRSPNYARKHRVNEAIKREKAKRKGAQPNMGDERLKCGERAMFRCERCNKYAPPEGPWWVKGDAHHRKYRSHGGPDSAENLEWLCPTCHKDEHDNNKPCPKKPVYTNGVLCNTDVHERRDNQESLQVQPLRSRVDSSNHESITQEM